MARKIFKKPAPSTSISSRPRMGDRVVGTIGSKGAAGGMFSIDGRVYGLEGTRTVVVRVGGWEALVPLDVLSRGGGDGEVVWSFGEA